MGDSTNAAYGEAHLGIVALGEHDAARAAAHGEAAAAHYREYLALAPVASDAATEDLARVVASVAVLAADRGEPERAARLLGASERLREILGLALAQPERATSEQANAKVLDELGEEASAAAFARGRAMPPAEALAEVDQALAPRKEAAPAGLSRREAEILHLIAAGRTNREIAETLFLSVHTVERHVTNLYAKIGARGRADATAFALRRGLA